MAIFQPRNETYFVAAQRSKDTIFSPVKRVEDGPLVGDALLFSIRGAGVPNHCAVYIGGGRVLHHLPGRLSREEDLGPLNRAVVAVVRRRA